MDALAEGNQGVPIIGLIGVIQSSFVAFFRTAFLATMDNHPAFFTLLLDANWLEQTTAQTGAITGEIIHMEAV